MSTGLPIPRGSLFTSPARPEDVADAEIVVDLDPIIAEAEAARRRNGDDARDVSPDDDDRGTRRHHRGGRARTTTSDPEPAPHDAGDDNGGEARAEPPASTMRRDSGVPLPIWFMLVAIILALGVWILAPSSAERSAVETAQPDQRGVISRTVADFTAAGMPNYWLDFSQTQGREKLYRGDAQVQACESHLASVWGGASNSSGPVHRNRAIATLEGQPITIPADAITCTAGPRGTTVVLATGSAYAAYHEYQLSKTLAGVSCGSIPADWGPGWRCVTSGSLDDMAIIPTPLYHVSGAKQCFQWKLRSNVLVFGDVKATSVTNPWESYKNQKAYPRVAFGHYEEDGPQAAFYRFYPMAANGQCIPPT